MPESADDVPTVLWVPSDRVWIDPPLVARTLYTQFSEYDTDPIISVKAAAFNPLRWGIGFSHVVFGGEVAISPVALSASDASGWMLRQGAALWFDLPTYTALVTGEWYLFPTSASRIRVYEVLRQA